VTNESNENQRPFIILVVVAISLSFFAVLFSGSTMFKMGQALKEPKVIEKVVYENFVPINAMLQDANSIVVLVELNYKHSEMEMIYVKRLVNEASVKYPSNQTSLLEEEIKKSRRVKNAWVYFRRLVIHAE